jgi:hypothetical protein
MNEPVMINAEQLTKAATHLRMTLFEWGRKVEQFDNAAAALMQQNEDFITRFENAVARLEKVYGQRNDVFTLERHDL